MSKHVISFAAGALLAVFLFVAMGAQLGGASNPLGAKYYEALQVLPVEIALYECKDAAGSDAIQKARLDRIKRYAGVIDSYRP